MIPCSNGVEHIMRRGWFLLDAMLGSQAKKLNLHFLRPKNFVTHGLRVLGMLFSKLLILLLRNFFHLATLPYRSDWWSAAKMAVFLEGSRLSTKQPWSSVRLSIRFLVTSISKDF